MTASQAARRAVEAHLRTSGLIDEPTLQRANQIAERTQRPFEQVLNQLGSLSDQALVEAYAAALQIPTWDPEAHPSAAPRPDVSVEFLRRSRLILVEGGSERVVCAACDPLDADAVDGLMFAVGADVAVLAARPADWRRDFERQYTGAALGDAELDQQRLDREIDSVDERGAESAGGRLVVAAFEAAIAAGASDIHFEPGRHGLVVRLRIDGKLLHYRTVSADLAAPAVSRVKVIANLDLGERRLPQDGRTTFVVAGRQVDVRVATAPTVFGESAVLRILDRATVPLDLNALGLSPRESDVLRAAASLPHGMFLVSGPTGSGKTTTLYALLQTLAGSDLKILSVEDPVEFQFAHVSQTQVAPQLGLTFARSLRSFLRQDPNVILVGEIRDPETAAVALQAAMTGHLVLASIHANDAVGVIARLLDMNIEPFQLNAAFRGASAQRLVRRLCPACREERPASAEEREIARQAQVAIPDHLAGAVGCEVCKGAGFKGRLAISEAFLTDDATLRTLTASGLDRTSDAAAALVRGGMLYDGLTKANQLLTTYDEVIAAVSA